MYGSGFYPQLDVCWVTATREVAHRRWTTLHEKAKPNEAGFLPTDGATVWMSPENLSPDDRFLDNPVDLVLEELTAAALAERAAAAREVDPST